MSVTTLDPQTALIVIDLQNGIVAGPTAYPSAERRSLSGFGWPVCESVCAVHISADPWSIEPLWTGKSSEIYPHTAEFSPRPPKPDRLLVARASAGIIKLLERRVVANAPTSSSTAAT
jgi:hypothetical protein